MHRRFLSGLLFFLLFASPALAAEKTRWLHVHVQDGDADSESVHINVPVSLVDGVLTLLREHEKDQKDGRHHFSFNDEEIDRAELRRLLAQLHDMPEGADVMVEKKDEKLWFSRQGDRLQIRVKEDDPKESEVHLRLPLKLAEAFSASDDVDLSQAIEALGHDGELLVVEDGDDSTVRIWIDGHSGSE